MAVKPGHEALPVYGGALSNPIRFPLEVLKRVKDAVGYRSEGEGEIF